MYGDHPSIPPFAKARRMGHPSICCKVDPPASEPTIAAQKKMLLTLAALWLLLYSSFTLFVRRCSMMPTQCTPRWREKWSCVMTGSLSTPTVSAISKRLRFCTGAWPRASPSLVRRIGPPECPSPSPPLPCSWWSTRLDRRLFASDTAGFYAALILLTSFGIFIYTRILIPDVIVCLWLSLAMLMFWISLEQPQPSRSTAWGFAVACALGVLTKGLIGVVFPLGIVFSFLLLNRNLGHLKRWHPVSSLLLFLIIALPWHIAAGIANPSQGQVHGFFWFYFINEHLLRYLNRRVPRDYDTVPLLLFWALLGAFLVPWIAFVFRALVPVRMRSSLRRVRLPRHDQAWNLLAIWAAFVMLFFSFSTRQEYYSLPALPPLALMIGGWLNREEKLLSSRPAPHRRTPHRRCPLFARSHCLRDCKLAGHTCSYPISGDGSFHAATQNPGDYALSLGHFLDLSARSMGAFRCAPHPDRDCLTSRDLCQHDFPLHQPDPLGNYTLVAMMVVMLIAAHSALVTFSPVLSSKALADAIGSRLHPGDVVEINGEYEAGSTLGFYLRRQVRILNGRSSDLWYGSTIPRRTWDLRRRRLIPPAVEWSKTNFPLDSEGSCSRPAGPGLRNRAKRGKRDPQQSTVARAAAFGPLSPPPIDGCPILRVLCEGWDPQVLPTLATSTASITESRKFVHRKIYRSDRREPAHLAVFQGEMLPPPRHGVPGKAPDPDPQCHHIARRQQPQIAQYLPISQHTHTH